LKNQRLIVLKQLWLMLTDVPGWPDAPLWARLRRASPVLLPCLGMLALAVWHFGIHAPRVRAELQAVQPLLALEAEIASLQLAGSEQQVADLAERAEIASRLLFDSNEDVAPFLRSLKKEAADRGFDATFIRSEDPGEPPPAEAVIAFVPVRGRLTPLAANTDPFGTLLALLERLNTTGKRIDLMRLSIRADEQKWQAIEMNFRLVAPVVHEKTP
jgi:hypothetical protein